MFKRALAIFAVLAFTSGAFASQDFVFRYKLGTNAATGSPETPTDPDAPLVCPEAVAPYSAAAVTPTENGCLYTAPTVKLESKPDYLPPVTETAIAALPQGFTDSTGPWCANVWHASHVSDNGTSEAVAPTAGFGADWGDSGTAGYATYVVCKGGDAVDPVVEIPDLDHTPIDVLRNADFEEGSCGFEMCGWWTWMEPVGAGFTDKQLGGSFAVRNWNGDVGQDVDVPPALTAEGFSVDLKWLQTTTTDSAVGSAGGVDLEFRSGSTVLGTAKSPVVRLGKAYVWFERSFKAHAPVGTKTVRVSLRLAGSQTVYDNVDLKMAGEEYSTINGNKGTPTRPADALLNAGGEDGSKYWRTDGNAIQFMTPNRSQTIDPFNFLGQSFAFDYYTAPPRGRQQVYIEETSYARPYSLKWFQSTDRMTSDAGVVSIEFYSRDGIKLSRGKLESHDQVPLFWTLKTIDGTVPAGAAVAVVDFEFLNGSQLQLMDAITLDVGGVNYAAVHGTSGSSFDYCPQYINTVNGSGEWSSELDNNNSENALWDEPLETGMNGEAYKNLCVPAGGGYLLGEYTINNAYAFGGFEYTARDLKGNVLARKSTLIGSGSDKRTSASSTEVFRFPPKTAYLQTRFVRQSNSMSPDFWISHTAGVNQYYLKATDINFTLLSSGDATLPSVPASKLHTKLVNGSADLGTDGWYGVMGSGFVSVFDQKVAVASADAWIMPPRPTASSSQPYCGNPCGEVYTNKAFVASSGATDAYQDVDIQSYGFAQGSTVELSWQQSATGAGFTRWLDAFGSSLNNAAMSIEARDVNGTLLASAKAPSTIGLFFHENRTVSLPLPAGTWSLRAVMHFGSNDKSLIDGIKLKVGTVDLTADDQTEIPWVTTAPPPPNALLVGADGESHLGEWDQTDGWLLQTRTSSPAPHAIGGNGYFYMPKTTSGRIDFYQDIVIDGSNVAGEPVSVEWNQASDAANKDTGTVNVRFLDDNGNDVGGTDAPLLATVGEAWRGRGAATTLPAGATSLRAVMSFNDVDGYGAAAYIDNISIRVGSRDYTDYTGPHFAPLILGADAEADKAKWIRVSGSGLDFDNYLASLIGSGGKYHSSVGDTSVHEQFVDVTAGNHAEGDTVHLGWHQSSGNGLDEGTVNVEFYGLTGQKVAATAMPLETTLAYVWETREASIPFPKGAVSMRVVMSMNNIAGSYALRAYIDDIRIRIGNKDYTNYTGPLYSNLIVNAGAEGNPNWWARLGIGDLQRDNGGAPNGGTYAFLSIGESANFRQDADIRAGNHASGQPFELSWSQSSLEGVDKGTVNVEFYGANWTKLGQTNMPLMATQTIRPSWTVRAASGALPAGTAFARVKIDMERVAGTYLNAYIDNIRLVIGGVDYTDFTGGP